MDSRNGGDIPLAATVSVTKGTLQWTQNCVHKPGIALHTQGHFPGCLIDSLQEREDPPGETTERLGCTIWSVVEIGQDTRVLWPELYFMVVGTTLPFFQRGERQELAQLANNAQECGESTLAEVLWWIPR